jgi:hypothetical protein
LLVLIVLFESFQGSRRFCMTLCTWHIGAHDGMRLEKHRVMWIWTLFNSVTVWASLLCKPAMQTQDAKTRENCGWGQGMLGNLYFILISSVPKTLKIVSFS